MAINYEKFLSWAESRFGDIRISGDEIKVNSIFEEDYKHKMSCNPRGGKFNLEYGVFHCWKSNKGGSLPKLVMLVDKCSYDEALDKLGGHDAELADLERRLEEFMSNRTSSTIEEITQPEIPSGFKFPEGTFPIKSLAADNLWRIEAEQYLLGRKLNPEEYFLCLEGDYKNRVIIPYYNANKELIYWNGRYLAESKKIPKYLGPHKDCGVGKSDVIYMAGNWPKENVRLHITEGEFDAKSLHIAGLHGAALGGKEIEEKQIEMIRPYIPVLCFDTDLNQKVDAGGNAILAIGDTLRSKGFHEIYYVRPPEKFKDWNKMLVDVGPKVIVAYIKQHIKRFTNETSIELKLKRI